MGIQREIEYGVMQQGEGKGITFYAKLGEPGKQIRINDTQGKLTFSFWHREISILPSIIKDLVHMSEEEFFQESTIWSHSECIEFIREVQRFGLSCFTDCELSTVYTGTINYEL